jgi:hypothetical protein
MPTWYDALRHDDLESPGVHAGGVDSGLVRLGAGRGEERFLQAAGSDLRNLLGERDHGLIRVERGGVAELVDLILLRRSHARITVADSDGYDAAEEIQVPLPLNVPDMLHLTAFERQRIGEVVGDCGIDELLLAGDDFLAVHGAGSSPA